MEKTSSVSATTDKKRQPISRLAPKNNKSEPNSQTYEPHKIAGLETKNIELQFENVELKKEITRLQREIAKINAENFSATEKLKAEHIEALKNMPVINVRLAGENKKTAAQLSDNELAAIAQRKT